MVVHHICITTLCYDFSFSNLFNLWIEVLHRYQYIHRILTIVGMVSAMYIYVQVAKTIFDLLDSNTDGFLHRPEVSKPTDVKDETVMR